MVLPILLEIQKLYQIEEQLRQTQAPPRRELVRQARSRPLVEQLYGMILAERSAHLPKSKLGEALYYALGQWEPFCRYLHNGELETTAGAAISTAPGRVSRIRAAIRRGVSSADSSTLASAGRSRMTLIEFRIQIGELTVLNQGVEDRVVHPRFGTSQEQIVLFAQLGAPDRVLDEVFERSSKLLDYHFCKIPVFVFTEVVNHFKK